MSGEYRGSLNKCYTCPYPCLTCANTTHCYTCGYGGAATRY